MSVQTALLCFLAISSLMSTTHVVRADTVEEVTQKLMACLTQLEKSDPGLYHPMKLTTSFAACVDQDYPGVNQKDAEDLVTIILKQGQKYFKNKDSDLSEINSGKKVNDSCVHFPLVQLLIDAYSQPDYKVSAAKEGQRLNPCFTPQLSPEELDQALTIISSGLTEEKTETSAAVSAFYEKNEKVLAAAGA